MSLLAASPAGGRVRRTELTPGLRAAVAQVMQCALLDEILGATVWKATDIVFQGGTSIHVVWNSPRFSEDLDFMVAVDRSEDIQKVVEKAARGVERRIRLTLPDSEVRLKPSTKEAGEVRVCLKHELVWSAPTVMGNVRLKAEFFTVERDHLQAYRREARRHEPDAMMISTRPELADLDLGDLTVHAVIPAAHPESIYGDKLVALAKRPYTKARDFFDLWWLSTQLKVEVPSERLYEVVRRSADCYVYTDHELVAGLRLLSEKPPSMARELEENLKAFLPERLHRRLSASGAFEQMYRHVMEEGTRLADVLVERAGPEIRP